MLMLNFKRKDILLKSFILHSFFFFFNIPFHDGAWQGIEYSSLCYSRSVLFICPVYTSLYLLIPHSQSFPPPPLLKSLNINCFHAVSAVKNLPAEQEPRVWSLGGEDPLEEGMATHSSILAWGRKESDRTERLSLSFLSRESPWQKSLAIYSP